MRRLSPHRLVRCQPPADLAPAVAHRHDPELLGQYSRLLSERGVEGIITVDTTVSEVPSVPTVAVAGHKKVKMSVVVEIDESCRDRPTSASDTCFCGKIREGPISIIVVEGILSVIGDEDVREAIVVVVADRHTHAVVSSPSTRKSSCFGNVGKTTIFVLAIKTVPIARVSAVELFGQ